MPDMMMTLIVPPARSSWIRFLRVILIEDKYYALITPPNRKSYGYLISGTDFYNWLHAQSKGRFYNQRIKRRRPKVRAGSWMNPTPP